MGHPIPRHADRSRLATSQSAASTVLRKPIPSSYFPFGHSPITQGLADHLRQAVRLAPSPTNPIHEFGFKNGTVMTINELPSRHINLWRKVKGPVGPRIYDRLDEIQEEVEAGEGRTRTRPASVSDDFVKCIRAICLDLFHANKVDPVMVTGVHRNHNQLTKNASYPTFVTARTFGAALDGLHATGYVEEVSKGTEGSGKTTRVRATPQLIQKMSVIGFSKPDISDNAEGIRLALTNGKSKSKVRTAYSDNAETARWRANLDVINREIGRHVIGLNRTRTELDDLEVQRRMSASLAAAKEKKPYDYQRLDMDAVRLHRVFNSADWCDGGRYYGGWRQNVPKEYRRFIFIDGKDTCEYDYSSIHPRLLYAQSGHRWPLNQDPYEAPHGPELRDAVKSAFLIMLNMQGTIQKRQVPGFDSATADMTWDHFVKGIVETHAPISKFLGTGTGVKLQRIDADIAEAVMLKFTKMHYACLPVHDSFITLASLGDELIDYMKQVVRETQGIEIEVTPKPTHTYSGPAGRIDTDISELLAPTDAIEKSLLLR